jgi:hypothetical protein
MGVPAWIVRLSIFHAQAHAPLKSHATLNERRGCCKQAGEGRHLIHERYGTRRAHEYNAVRTHLAPDFASVTTVDRVTRTRRLGGFLC